MALFYRRGSTPPPPPCRPACAGTRYERHNPELVREVMAERARRAEEERFRTAMTEAVLV